MPLSFNLQSVRQAVWQLPKLVVRLPKWALTPDQAQRLLSVLAALPRTLVSLAIMTGVRRGELFALRWKTFDELRATLTIQEAIYEGVIDRPKTALSLRVIPLSPSLVQLLREWKVSAIRKAPEDFIFASRDGKPKEH